MLMTNKQVFDDLSANMGRYSLAPTWRNLTKLMAGAVVGSFKHKDFRPRSDVASASVVSTRRPDSCIA